MGQRTQKEKLFDDAYKSYAADVYRVCFHLTHDEKEAEEITQQTFVKFYRCLESIDSDCIFEYMVCTAEALARNHRKDLKKKK